jgi:hypothetical protein
MDSKKTQPLPKNWRQRYESTLPEVRVRYPRTTASVAVTAQIPVIAVG